MHLSGLRLKALIAALGAALLVAFSSTTAVAASKSITGSFGKKGYTVIAVGYDGKATSADAKKFSLKPPAAKFTLHLRDASGNYAGPVVVGTRGKTVILGVKPGAKLGKLKLKKGYFQAGSKLGKKFIDTKRVANAKKGAPAGANKLGRVKAKASGTSGPGTDIDSDGIPGAFDVDDDGDLVLDNFDTGATMARVSRRAVAAACDPPPAPCDESLMPPPGGLLPAPGGEMPPPPGEAGPMPGGEATPSFRVFSNFKLSIEQSLNANAGVTDAQIDETMQKAQTLAIQVSGGSEVELDCGALTYCSAGGTGTWMNGGAFPGVYDGDGDGFGTLQIGPTGDFQLQTGAKSSEIGSGDTMIQHIVDSEGNVSQVAGVLNYVFSTTPALVNFDAGGVSGSVSYPVAPGSPGAMNSPITVAGDTLTMTFWRPQRKAIAGTGEGDGWVDIGGLRYVVDIPNPPGGGSGGGSNCTSAYSSSDADARVAQEGIEDQAVDKPASPANTLTFTFDFAKCFTERGITWNSGEKLAIDIQAKSNDGDNAAQKIHLIKG